MYKKDLALNNLQWLICHKTIVDHLMPNSLYTYILDIYDLDWLGFMANQPHYII